MPIAALSRELKDRIRKFSQEMWDLRLKLSPATRTLAECEKFDPNNVEFAISLLDCRYLAGDRELFARLHDQSIPKLVSRESRSIVQRLTDLTRARYNKFGNTVFHLEPNVKDGPGGLRDYNLAHWLALIAAMEEKAGWPDEAELLPPWLRPRFEAALDFLMSVRCFLHFRHGRDDNTLAWVAQDEAAARKIGVPDADSLTASDWMRIYYGHARLIHRVAAQLLEEFPAARPSLYRQFQNLRSRLSNAEFAVVDGRIFLQRQESLKRSRAAAAHVPLHGAPRLEPQLGHRAPDGGNSAVAGQGARRRAPSYGTTCRRFCWLRTQPRRCARCTRSRLLDASGAGISGDRCARDPRLLAPLHGGRAHFRRHRESRTPCENRNRNGTSATPSFSTNSSSPTCSTLRLLLHDTGKGAESDNHVIGERRDCAKRAWSASTSIRPTARRFSS